MTTVAESGKINEVVTREQQKRVEIEKERWSLREDIKEAERMAENEKTNEGVTSKHQEHVEIDKELGRLREDIVRELGREREA